MQRLFQHISTFADTLKQKGYDGYFQSSFGYNDKLKDNLVQHVLQCLEEKRSIGPLNLTTFSRWTDDKSPYVRSNFYADFTDGTGFQVTKMNMEYGNGYGPIRHKEMLIQSNAQIPDRDQLNLMMLEKKKGLKI